LFGQVYADLTGSVPEKSFGEGGQQPGAITTAAVGVDTTAVRQPGQGRERPLHDLVGTGTTELRDETYTARIMIGRKVLAILCHYPCVPSMAAKSTIENFDDRNGFFRSAIRHSAPSREIVSVHAE
jgi:hypothetical protein